MRELFNRPTGNAIIRTSACTFGAVALGLSSSAQIAPVRDYGQKIKLDSSVRFAPGAKLYDSYACRIRISVMSDNARKLAFAASRTVFIINHHRQTHRRHDVPLETDFQTGADCSAHIASSRIRDFIATLKPSDCTIRHIDADGHRATPRSSKMAGRIVVRMRDQILLRA